MNPIECLESRRLLAASATLLGTTLLVRGDELAANAIDVTYNVDGVHVDVAVVSTPLIGSPVSLNQQFIKADITMVKVRGGRVADDIDLSTLTTNSRVNGVSGADSISTGSGNDRIAGGGGGDLINAGAGNDLVHGERGNDSISGGEGDDALWGGVGEDTINGGAGHDILGGLLGTNVLTGGADADTFVIKPGGQSQASDFVDGVDAYRIRTTGSTDGSVPPPTA